MTIILTREEAQQVLDAVSLAMSSHDVMLASDPPQDAWKARGVQTRLAGVWATLRARLAQPEREWQELTDEEIKRYKPVCADLDSFRAGVKAVEAKLKEKNAADA
jgi:hypothetical protein